MALETGTYIDDLVEANPTSTDPVKQGDDHLRLIKKVLKNTFANITNAVTVTHTELNRLGGVTSNVQNQLDDKLDASDYTANDILTKLKTVDGEGSGLDAAKFEGLDAADFLRSNDDDTFSGAMLMKTTSGGKVPLKVFKLVDSGSEVPALVIGNDGESSDILIEARSNTDAASVDQGDTGNSADAKFQVFGDGDVHGKLIGGDWRATQSEAEAGSSSTKVMTPQRVKQAINARSFGESHDVSDVSGSRSANTSYQNTLDYPIYLWIRPSATGGGKHIELSSNGSTWKQATVSGAVETFVQTAIVPAGHYYKFTASFSIWNELR